VTDGQTDGRTDRRAKLRLPRLRYSIAASRGKNDDGEYVSKQASKFVNGWNFVHIIIPKNLK